MFEYIYKTICCAVDDFESLCEVLGDRIF